MFPAEPAVPVDPKPPGQARGVFCSGAFLGGGWGSQNQKTGPPNLPSSFQGEMGYPGLPGCKGSPGFDVSRFLFKTVSLRCEHWLIPFGL